MEQESTNVFPVIDMRGDIGVFISTAEQLGASSWSGFVQTPEGNTIDCPYIFDTDTEFHEFAEADWRKCNQEPDFPHRWDINTLPRKM